MNWFKSIFLLVAFAGAFFLWKAFSSRSVTEVLQSKVKIQAQIEDGAKLYFSFTPGDHGWLARSGDIFIQKNDLKNLKVFNVHQTRQKDLLNVLTYLQYAVKSKTPPQKIRFFSKGDLNQFRALLNQYGVSWNDDVKVSFRKSQNLNWKAEIDGRPVAEEAVDKNHYLWGAIKTEEFHWQLSEIDKKIKEKRLLAEATKLKMPIQEYRRQYVAQYMKKGLTEEKVEKFRRKKSIENNSDGKKLAKRLLRESLEKRGLDYFMEKFLLDLPIQVNLKPLDFSIELGHEYVPYFGPKNSELSISVFSDSTSRTSVELTSEIYKIANKYSGIHLEARPILSSGNIFQEVRAKIDYCVWDVAPEIYWEFYVESQGFFNEKTQEKLFAVVEAMNQDVVPIEKCFHSKRSEEIVEYHKKYADYLGIYSGPIVFVGGEVLRPPVNIEKVKRVINRQLGFADAAVW